MMARPQPRSPRGRAPRWPSPLPPALGATRRGHSRTWWASPPPPQRRSRRCTQRRASSASAAGPGSSPGPGTSPGTPPTTVVAWSGRWHSPSGPGESPGQGPPGTRTLDGTDTKRKPQGTPMGRLPRGGRRRRSRERAGGGERRGGGQHTWTGSSSNQTPLCPILPAQHAHAHASSWAHSAVSGKVELSSCQRPPGQGGLPPLLEEHRKRLEAGRQ